MKHRRELAPPHPALQALATATAPTEAEVEHLLSRRPTRVDAELRDRIAAMADATEATWAEELHARPETSPLAGRDPRAPSWARATDPVANEVARVTTQAPPPSFAAHSQPLPVELAALTHGRVPAAWAPLTEPTDDEVRRVLVRRADLVPTRRRATPVLLGIGAVAAAAAALFAIALWPTGNAGYGTPDLAQGVTAMVAPSDVVDLGPSIDLTAHPVPGFATPSVHVARADVSGTVVDVLGGGTRFEVDPAGAYRALTVRAGDVEVRVKGTVFTVDRLDHAVEVAVERGRVEVTTPAGRFQLVAGEQWSSASDATASVDESALSVDESAIPADEFASDSIDGATLVDATLAQAEPGATDAVAAPRPARVAPPREARSRPAVKPPAEPAPVPTQADDAPTVQSEVEADALSVPEVPTGQADDDDSPAASTEAPAGESAPVPITTAAVDLVAIHRLRQRDQAGEEPATLLPDVERLLEQHPDDRLLEQVLRLRVDVITRTGDLRALDDALGNLIAHSPADRAPALHVERARVRERRGDLRGALGTYRRAEDAPGAVGIQALVGIATAAHALNRPNEARDALLEALQRAPDPETEERLTAILESLNQR